MSSYEQASYAIQDTPDVVQQHYGRFLPQDKAALAARILNQVWRRHKTIDVSLSLLQADAKQVGAV